MYIKCLLDHQPHMEGTRGINIGKDKFPGSLFSIATALTNELQESFPRIILTDDGYTAHEKGNMTCEFSLAQLPAYALIVYAGLIAEHF